MTTSFSRVADTERTSALPGAAQVSVSTGAGASANVSANAGAGRLRFVALVVGLCIVVAAGVVIEVVAAGGDIGWGEVMRSVGSKVGASVDPLSPLADSIVWELRMPRALLAAIAGAGLALCGCVLQAVTRNALADPYLLGISSGASTGAVIVMVVGAGSGALALSGGALVGGLAAFALVFGLLGRSTVSSTRIVLTGVVVGQLFAALTSLVVTVWGNGDNARGLLYWLLGSLAAARWTSVLACAIAVALAAVVYALMAPSLDAFAFGERSALSLGFEVGRVRLVALMVAAATTAVIVASVGAIGFVGLIVPHAARLIVGAGHRRLLPVSALIGAAFLPLADAAGRWIFAPQQIPVGVLTALIGVPVFLVLMRRQEARA